MKTIVLRGLDVKVPVDCKVLAQFTVAPFRGNSELPLCPVNRDNDQAALAQANAKIEAARKARSEQRELRRAAKSLALQS